MTDWLFYISIAVVIGLAFWLIPTYVGWAVARMCDEIDKIINKVRGRK